MVRVAGRIDADMPHAELGPDLVIGVVAWPDLGADIHGHFPEPSAQKNASVRISMLSRGRAWGGVVGSSKAVWAVNRARPSFRESYTLKTNASSGRICGNQYQRWA